MPQTKVPVSMRALLQRINRKLGKEGEVLKKCRGYVPPDIGLYFVVNISRNSLECTDVDPVVLGKELGVLAPWEAVKPEER